MKGVERAPHSAARPSMKSEIGGGSWSSRSFERRSLWQTVTKAFKTSMMAGRDGKPLMGSILRACNDPNDLILHVYSRTETSLGGCER